MENITIYKLTCGTTGKEYIGKTKHDIKTRLQQHKSRARHRHSKLCEAIQLYGIDDFTAEVLDNQFSEEHYITLYDTFNNGYNSTYDGKTGCGQGGVLFKKKNNRTLLWWITSPCGKSCWLSNLSKLSDEEGLSKSAMYKVADGERESHQGWKVERITTN